MSVPRFHVNFADDFSTMAEGGDCIVVTSYHYIGPGSSLKGTKKACDTDYYDQVYDIFFWEKTQMDSFVP